MSARQPRPAESCPVRQGHQGHEGGLEHSSRRGQKVKALSFVAAVLPCSVQSRCTRSLGHRTLGGSSTLLGKRHSVDHRPIASASSAWTGPSSRPQPAGARPRAVRRRGTIVLTGRGALRKLAEPLLGKRSARSPLVSFAPSFVSMRTGDRRRSGPHDALGWVVMRRWLRSRPRRRGRRDRAVLPVGAPPARISRRIVEPRIMQGAGGPHDKAHPAAPCRRGCT